MVKVGDIVRPAGSWKLGAPTGLRSKEIGGNPGKVQQVRMLQKPSKLK